MISWPCFSTEEIDAVTCVLKSGKVNYWTGDECKQFEKEFATYFGVKHAIALMNGTVALEAALHALDIGPGDDVIVPCRTFIASASAVVRCGARPIVADIDLNSQNITVDMIRAAMTSSTKAIMCVHLAGWPCDMPVIMEFARENNLYVIEDCAQSHGAKVNGQYAGSFGDISTFSFCQDKIMTTGGEGGMLVTDNEVLFKKAWSYKEHGKDYDAALQKEQANGFRWLHEKFGTNLRMTEMQAAIGRVQLRKIAGWIQKRQHFAAMYDAAFQKIEAFRVLTPPENIHHAYYKYYVFIAPEKLKQGWSRDRIMHSLNERGVPCFTGSCPEIYLEKAFSKKNYKPKNHLVNARKLGKTSLMFLVNPFFSEKNIECVISEIQAVMEMTRQEKPLFGLHKNSTLTAQALLT
ncbi:MAG: DegT/DnrJ/EryC1/StrS aminotransferase family protein [Gammaproteobacteria bacterium]|nr:DegT/DnrJ/EryC1/StrS aminotransferase family protein [Gammaproteobacteria bacterium]